MIYEFCALLGIITQFCRIMLFGVFKGSIMSLEPYIRLARKTNELSSKSLSKRLLSRFVRSKLEVAKLTNNINRTRNLGKGEGVAEEFWNCKSGERPPLSPNFTRCTRKNSRNLETTAAGSPNIPRSSDGSLA